MSANANPIVTDMWNFSTTNTNLITFPNLSTVNYNYYNVLSTNCNPNEKTTLFYNTCIPGYSCLGATGSEYCQSKYNN